MALLPPEGVLVLVLTGIAISAGVIWKIRESYLSRPQTRSPQPFGTEPKETAEKNGLTDAAPAPSPGRKHRRIQVPDRAAVGEGRNHGLEEEERRRRRRRAREKARGRALGGGTRQLANRDHDRDGHVHQTKRYSSTHGHHKRPRRGKDAVRKRHDSGFQEEDGRKRAHSWRREHQHVVERDVTDMMGMWV